MSDEFCIFHGYEHMRSQIGNKIPFCEECERRDGFERTDRIYQSLLKKGGDDGNCTTGSPPEQSEEARK